MESTIQYLSIRGNFDNDDDLCDLSSLTQDGKAYLEDVLASLNLDAQLYDSHSFRIGCASDMLKNNYSLIFFIKQAGNGDPMQFINI